MLIFVRVENKNQLIYFPIIFRSSADIKDPILETATPIKSIAPTVIAAQKDFCGVTDQAEEATPIKNIVAIAKNNSLFRPNRSQAVITPKRGR